MTKKIPISGAVDLWACDTCHVIYLLMGDAEDCQKGHRENHPSTQGTVSLTALARHKREVDSLNQQISDLQSELEMAMDEWEDTEELENSVVQLKKELHKAQTNETYWHKRYLEKMRIIQRMTEQRSRMQATIRAMNRKAVRSY